MMEQWKLVGKLSMERNTIWAEQMMERWKPDGSKIGGYWYYFGGADDGSLKTNTWIGNYYVDGNGRWTKTRKTDKQILSEFISGGNYKRYTNGYSNLSYAIADLNADSVPELLIESKTEASGFYVTWVLH